MTKKQPVKKKPIKVQLSKEDLVELLTVLKNFMSEEISQRISLLERHIKAREIKRISYCYSHENRLDHISYSSITGKFLSADYKCSRCGEESYKTWSSLTRKEKKALQKLGVKI